MYHKGDAWASTLADVYVNDLPVMFCGTCKLFAENLILSNRISAMDGGDMLEERKYMVLSEKTIEKLIIIEKIVGGDRARKAIARWITVNISLSFDESDLYE
ncbi:unnamed protein product [Toxocara canis]|uniref:ELFV_dehydrog domain-containing protein n=1 Tax=Toxocara canis TaxID=6265 RepID=A0A183V8M1_TOXCA|nr:unnamed protein product [Toxocara canis]